MRTRFALVLASLVVAAACGGGEEPPSEEAEGSGRTYVGAVEGTEALIGLVYDGTNVAGYVSDSAAVSIWLGPSGVDNGLAELRHRDTADFEGAVEFYDGGARGEIHIQGAPFSFDAQPAEGEAGIYYDEADGVDAAWVVANDGTTKGPGGEARRGSRRSDPNAEPFADG